MAGIYSITLVPERFLVRVTMSGFYEPDEALAFGQDIVRAQTRLECAPNDHLTLCDIRDMAIQSQSAVEAFMRVVGSDRIRSRKLAFVVARSLARMQARRLTTRPNVEFFEDVTDAEAWLGVAGARIGDPAAGPAFQNASSVARRLR